MNARWAALFALALGLGALWWALPARQAARPPHVGEHVAPVALPDLAGKVRPLPAGKVVLLNFWATWCPPCREETPSMVKLYERLKGEGLEIYAVSVDRDDAAVQRFVKRFRVSYPVLRDPQAAAARRFGVFKFPETFIIDRRGVIRYHQIGALDWSDPGVVRALEALLSERG